MEIIAILFFFLMLAVAYITFRMLKKVVKMTVRAVIALLILMIALVGGLVLWNVNAGIFSDKKPSTTTDRSR